MTDVAYNHGKTKPQFGDTCVATRIDGSASYWRLSRGYAGKSTHHVIYTNDGRTITAGTEASAIKKLGETK
jgi:hypothetical protein